MGLKPGFFCVCLFVVRTPRFFFVVVVMVGVPSNNVFLCCFLSCGVERGDSFLVVFSSPRNWKFRRKFKKSKPSNFQKEASLAQGKNYFSDGYPKKSNHFFTSK